MLPQTALAALLCAVATALAAVMGFWLLLGRRLALGPSGTTSKPAHRSGGARQLDSMAQYVRWLAGGVVVVDLNNVRGAFGFRRASVAALAGLVVEWGRSHGLCVALHVDHGPEASALVRAGALFVFSGTRLEADDTIVLDVAWLLREAPRPALVVTSDRGLRGRCGEALRQAIARERAADAGEWPVATWY